MMDEAVEIQPLVPAEVIEAVPEEPKNERRRISKFAVSSAIFGFLFPFILIFTGAMGNKDLFLIAISLIVLCIPVGLVTGVISILQVRRYHIGSLVLSLLGIVSSIYWGRMMILLYHAMKSLSEMD